MNDKKANEELAKIQQEELKRLYNKAHEMAYQQLEGKELDVAKRFIEVIKNDATALSMFDTESFRILREFDDENYVDRLIQLKQLQALRGIGMELRKLNQRGVK